MKIEWEAVTPNCHVAKLGDWRVASVTRNQKHQPDGSKYPWNRIDVLGMGSLSNLFDQADERDLDSVKSAVEARVRFVTRNLTESLRSRSRA